MTRAERLKKLGNAVRRYRGRIQNGKWITAPQVNARASVRLWLERLGYDTEAHLEAIDSFQTFPEFREWIDRLT